MKPSSIATVIAATTCMGGFATAQESRSHTLTIATDHGELHRLSHIIGKDARDARGEDLGRVRNVAVDLQQGNATYITLSVDGESVPLRWRMINISGFDEDSNEIELIVGQPRGWNQWGNATFPYQTQVRLREYDQDVDDRETERKSAAKGRGSNYPGSTGNRAGEMAAGIVRGNAAKGDNADSDSENLAEQKPSISVEFLDDPDDVSIIAFGSGQSQVVSASDLIGADAYGPNRAELGEIVDVLVHDNGRVAFFVVASGGPFGWGERFVAVPFELVNRSETDIKRDRMALNIDRDQLRDAPYFKKKDWPRSISDSIARDAYAYFNASPTHNSVYGYTAPSNGLATDFNSVIANWPEPSRQAALEMSRKYGKPAVMARESVQWVRNGPWLRTIVHRNPVSRDFPIPHMDVLEQWIDFRVPADMLDELAQFSGSVIIYGTDGSVASCCDQERMNMATLNLAHDIVLGHQSVEVARQELMRIAQEVQEGGHPRITQQLVFFNSNYSSGAYERQSRR